MPNKPYFARWFPAEGEVKAGDHYKLVGNRTDVFIAESDNLDQREGLLGRIRLQLFLCSRNIKVGDKVFTDDEAWPNTVEIEWDEINEKENEPYKSQTYKVIGPISPEAAWVKEGDQFDENEIRRDILTKWYAGEDDYIEYVHRHPKGTETIVIPSDEEFITESPIKIKGPCTHFH